MALQWKSEASYADSNGVINVGDWLTGSETGGVTVVDLGAYCVAVPGQEPVNSDWSETQPSWWPTDIGVFLLPSAGTFVMSSDGTQTGDLEKYFYFRAWPGVLAEARFWRITE